MTDVVPRTEHCEDCYFCNKTSEAFICLRNPPKVIDPCSMSQIYNHYPVVSRNWWCGEFKRKENK